MVADIEELEEMDASELHARRLNAKEVLTPMKCDNFIFRAADGTAKTPGRNRRLKPPTLIRDHPERGEEQEILQGKSDGLSFPTPHQDDSTLDGAEAKNDFTGDFICRHHEERAERRIISCLIEVHRRDQKYAYIIGFPLR